jgi:hypothetical protein
MRGYGARNEVRSRGAGPAHLEHAPSKSRAERTRRAFRGFLPKVPLQSAAGLPVAELGEASTKRGALAGVGSAPPRIVQSSCNETEKSSDGVGVTAFRNQSLFRRCRPEFSLRPGRDEHVDLLVGVALHQVAGP